MQTLNYDDVERLLKTKELAYHNIYNADIPINAHYATQYYLRHQYDTIDQIQILNKILIDIEVFTDNENEDDLVEDAKYPINAVTLYSTTDRIYKAYYLLDQNNFAKFGITQDPDFDFKALIDGYQSQFKEILVNEKYITKDQNIQIIVFNDEATLIYEFWKEVHRIDPDVLSGWNSDRFDFPYIYNRCKRLFGIPNTNKLMSKLGQVTAKGGFITIPEFTILDLLYAYKPRDEQGLNLGKKQARYTLDNIANVELGLRKLEYKNKTQNLNTLYYDDPVYFLLYNIIDVTLVVNLDEKLKHVDLYNMIRRIMRTPFGASIAGSSVLFDTFIYSKLTEENKFIRYGMNSEGRKTINDTDDAFFRNPLLKDHKGAVIKPLKIAAKSYGTFISRYPGAFVKIPSPTIINNGSIVLDLDATSLYPSMILQSNISFDSYYGRVIPVNTYKMLALLEQCIGRQQLPPQIFTNIEQMVWAYSKTVKTKKGQTANNLYYIITKLLDSLVQCGLTIEQIYDPTSTYESVVLRTIFIPLIDLINMIHPANKGHSSFMYDYFFKAEETFRALHPEVYIIHNAGETNTTIGKYTLDNGLAVMEPYIKSLAGTLFKQHAEHLGLFTNFLLNMGNLRAEYKRARQTSKGGSFEYTFNDNRQASVKVIMNTTYGLYGLSSFRYSNHWLAQSITNNGEMTIKLAQVIGDQHLVYKYGDLTK